MDCRVMLSFSAALVSLPFSLSHLCLTGGQKEREMAVGGKNRGLVKIERRQWI